MRTRLAVIIVSLVAVIVSCGIPDSGGVSKIPDKDVSGLNDTLPTTSTSTTAPTIETTVPIETAPVSTVAVEDVTLYFISGGLLKSYLAPPIAKNASANQILGALQAGITKDGSVGVGLRTAVPTADHPITVVEDGSGVATVDLPPDFYDQIPQEDQLLVIGQIVLTLTDIAGIGQVLFRQNGQPLGVNRGSGGLSSGTEPLARRDYDSLLNTPVTNPTTTSAVTSSLPTTVT